MQKTFIIAAVVIVVFVLILLVVAAETYSRRPQYIRRRGHKSKRSRRCKRPDDGCHKPKPDDHCKFVDGCKVIDGPCKDKMYRALNIAVIVRKENDIDIPERTYQCYTKFVIETEADAEKFYNQVKTGYDLILGGNRSSDTDLWIKSGSKTPLIAVETTSIFEMTHPDLLHRLVPDLSRNFAAVLYAVQSLNPDSTEEDIFNRSGLVANETSVYSKSFVKVFGNLGAAATGQTFDDYVATHVRYVTDRASVGDAMRYFAQNDIQEIMYAAPDSYDALIDDGVVLRSRIATDDAGFKGSVYVFNRAFIRTFATAYVINDGSGTIGNDISFNLYPTSPGIHDPPVSSDETYVPPQNWITLLYEHAVTKLETIRCVADVPRAFDLVRYITTEYGNQGYQPMSMRLFPTGYFSDLYGLTTYVGPEIEDYAIRGYIDGMYDPESQNSLYKYNFAIVRTNFADAVIIDPENKGGSLKYSGAYGQGVNLTYDDLQKRPALILLPYYGNFITTPVAYDDTVQSFRGSKTRLSRPHIEKMF